MHSSTLVCTDLCFPWAPTRFRTALAIHRYSKVNWTKTALEDGFLSFDFESGRVFYLEDEVVTADKCARGTSVTSTSFHIPAIPVLYRDGVPRVILESVKRDHDEYHEM